MQHQEQNQEQSLNSKKNNNYVVNKITKKTVKNLHNKMMYYIFLKILKLLKCYNSNYAFMLIVMLMTMLMTMFLTIVDRSSLDYQIVSKSTLFKVNLCSFESYK